MMHIPEKEFLKMWKIKPMAATDIVAYKGKNILLTKRAVKPFKGKWVLPGGLMESGETIEKTALRELKEETGFTGKIERVIGIYSGPKRDPRGTTITVAYIVKLGKKIGKHDRESSEVCFFPFRKIPKNLGFDHKTIIRDALKIIG